MSGSEAIVLHRRILVVRDDATGIVVTHEKVDAEGGEAPIAFYERIGERKKELEEEYPESVVAEYGASSLSAVLGSWPEDFRPKPTSAP